MAKVIRLTETDLTRLVKRVIIEMDSDMPRRKKGILGHKDSWYDEMDRPVNPDEFDYDEEIEFGPDDYEDYINHTERDFSKNKWPFGMRGHKKQDMGPGKEYWSRYQQDGPIKLRKKSMTEETNDEEPSEAEVRKLVDYFWDSMTTGEKRRFMAKVDKERKEKGLPPIRTKSSRIMKKDK
jgi:hypothetical protein